MSHVGPKPILKPPLTGNAWSCVLEETLSFEEEDSKLVFHSSQNTARK